MMLRDNNDKNKYKFKREIDLMTETNKRNCLGFPILFDSFTDKNYYYIVM